MEETWVEIAGEDNLDPIIGKIRFLPAMPWVVHRMLEIIENENSSAQDLADVISGDQTLTARVLKMCNSAYYGFSREVTTVSEAVVILGFNTIRSLVISVSIFDMFDSDPHRTALDRREFWLHSVSAAVAARYLAQRVGHPRPEEAFVGGLLHDIGKIIFNEFTPDDYKRCVELVRRYNIPIVDAEHEVYGFNHAIMGAWLGAKWELPETLQQTIAYHHDPHLYVPGEEDQAANDLRVVPLADAMSKACGIGFGGDHTLYPVSAVAGLTLPSPHQLAESFHTMPNKVRQTSIMFGLDQTTEGESFTIGHDEGFGASLPAERPVALILGEPGHACLSSLVLQNAGYIPVTSTNDQEILTMAASRIPEIIVWEKGPRSDPTEMIRFFSNESLAGIRKAAVASWQGDVDDNLHHDIAKSCIDLGLKLVRLPAHIDELRGVLDVSFNVEQVLPGRAGIGTDQVGADQAM